MVPMYYAFQTQNQEYIEMFQKHMDRFAALTEKEKEAFREIGLLDRLHYMYFVTEYMCLCAENRVPVSEQLYSFVYSEMEDVTENYTGAWKSTAEYKNMWELLDGLLTGEGYGNGKSYECAVTDFELFSLAVLCDLKVIAEEDSVGIGPYQNSVCFLLGWYAFSGNDEISEAYRETAQKFPLDVNGKKLYTDPTTIREQNPIFTMENYRQFLCYLAGKLEF